MNIKKDCQCSFCYMLTEVAIEENPIVICPNCISKARLLISEYRVNGIERLEDIPNDNEF